MATVYMSWSFRSLRASRCMPVRSSRASLWYFRSLIASLCAPLLVCGPIAERIAATATQQRSNTTRPTHACNNCSIILVNICRSIHLRLSVIYNIDIRIREATNERTHTHTHTHYKIYRSKSTLCSLTDACHDIRSISQYVTM
jgi:hypothetical protein